MCMCKYIQTVYVFALYNPVYMYMSMYPAPVDVVGGGG